MTQPLLALVTARLEQLGAPYASWRVSLPGLKAGPALV
jgi:hypothetical protein